MYLRRIIKDANQRVSSPISTVALKFLKEQKNALA